MTALSAAFDRKCQTPGVYIPVPVKESETIYAGAAVMTVRGTGYAVPGADTASGIFLGIAQETIDNSSGSSGDLNVRIRRDGRHVFTLTSVTEADRGKKCYLTDDNTVALSGQSNDVFCGYVDGVYDTNKAWVLISPAAAPAFTVTTAPAAITSNELTDSCGGTDPEDQELPAVTLPAEITDSSGGADSGDDTLAVVVNTNALTDNGGGTADQTVEDVADIAIATSGGNTYADSAVNTAVNTAIASVSNNFKEMTTELALQRTANTTLLAHVAQLTAKMNVVRTALGVVLNNLSLLAAEHNLVQDDAVALRATIATIETEQD